MSRFGTLYNQGENLTAGEWQVGIWLDPPRTEITPPDQVFVWPSEWGIDALLDTVESVRQSLGVHDFFWRVES